MTVRAYSTRDACGVPKAAFWNDLHRKLLAPLEVIPLSRGEFDAEFRIGTVGPLSIRSTASMPARIESTIKHIVTAHDQTFFLMMPLEGSVRVTHYGRTAVLERGDSVMIDGTSPSRTEFTEPNRAIHLAISRSHLVSHFPCPEVVCGLKAQKSGPLGSVLCSLFEDVWRQVESGLSDRRGLVLARYLLDSIAASYALQFSTKLAASVVGGSREIQIKRFIEERLRDKALTSGAIADHFGISKRYVRRLFERGGESVASYIRRRRLEECERQINSVHCKDRSIAHIAEEWAFSSRAHFSRIFRKHFGRTPRELRQQPP